MPPDVNAADTALPTDADVSAPDTSTPPTFGTECGKTTLKGTVYAPNGQDPVAHASVYVASQVNPFPAANFCDLCQQPIDTSYVRTPSNADGTFTLDVSSVPYASNVTFVVTRMLASEMGASAGVDDPQPHMLKSPKSKTCVRMRAT